MADSHVFKRPASTSQPKPAKKTAKHPCRACILRKIVCDQGRPSCSQCREAQVQCSYRMKRPADPGRSPSSDGSSSTVLSTNPSTSQTILAVARNAIAHSASSSSLSDVVESDPYPMDLNDMRNFYHFQTRTVGTIGAAWTGRMYDHDVVETFVRHPYLKHAVITVAQTHARHMSSELDTTLTDVELYHSGRAASLLNEKLSQPLQPADHDAVWATTALLGVFGMALMETNNPEEIWPMRYGSASEGERFHTSEGIHTIWRLVYPFPTGSAFAGIALTTFEDHALGFSTPDMPTDELVSDLTRLCGINRSSNESNNAYYTAVSNLVPMLDTGCNQLSMQSWLTSSAHIRLSLDPLLATKDARALLVLLYWTTKVCHCHWWTARRATLTARAICLYLDRLHGDNAMIQRLLEYAKMAFGAKGDLMGSIVGTVTCDPAQSTAVYSQVSSEEP